ncbi:dihydrolipoyl dehydrogenase family protein [Candidatus Nitrospira allomarina]|uniref:Dihydrolipoyl dehydrogenase n=1 Tax=Candidatus Nitrospira allomarina TaxID=3020900 RepID=A0AA96GD24_9BACT|nr:dihydrolipoyl dehydrogenase [Candidatus Nitrospira allomarina]WNM57695.1 dihydrolipoyl dehydrogenase [Candidatus Nitrospira allomarina]
MTYSHDLIIIGGGSAGYAAARTAQAQGADVGIVDQGPLGGLCILRGCMPTKAILRSSDLAALIRRAPEFGLHSTNLQVSLAAIIDRKNRLIKEFAEDRIQALKHPRFTLYQEHAHFVSPTIIQAGHQRLSAKAYIIATGSVISHIPIPGLEEAGYLTSDEVLELDTMPESMIVLGGGPVALELAQFFSRIGVNVTLIQRSGHILSDSDEDLVRPVEAHLRAEGMTVYTNTRLQHISTSGGTKTVHFLHQGQPQQVSATTILQALGRRPNIDGLNLEAAQVAHQTNAIFVNKDMRTSQPQIFAVGDVNGGYEIVHIAIEEGEIAGWNAVHPNLPPKHFDSRLKTQVVFTDPQLASVGLSERECLDRQLPYLVASYPFNDHGKSLCLGETYGHVKVLCHPESGEILGGHIVGPEASELIHELIAIMHFHGTVHDLLRIPHYHPTLAEILTYPAEELVGKLPSV